MAWIHRFKQFRVTPSPGPTGIGCSGQSAASLVEVEFTLVIDLILVENKMTLLWNHATQMKVYIIRLDTMELTSLWMQTADVDLSVSIEV